MFRNTQRIAPVIALALLSSPAPVLATNGYFMHGYGNLSKGMGGVAYALPQDALAPASNPAGLMLLHDRIDVGIDWIGPRRSASIAGNRQLTLRSADGDFSGDRLRTFFVPELVAEVRHGHEVPLGDRLAGHRVVDPHALASLVRVGESLHERVVVDPCLAGVGETSKLSGRGDLFGELGVLLDLQREGENVEGDIESQTERTLRNVEAVLLEAGSSLDQVLSLMIFLTDREDWAGVNGVCERMFGVHRPARAVIGGAALKAGCRIEITAVGAIPDRP